MKINFVRLLKYNKFIIIDAIIIGSLFPVSNLSNASDMFENIDSPNSTLNSRAEDPLLIQISKKEFHSNEIDWTTETTIENKAIKQLNRYADLGKIKDPVSFDAAINTCRIFIEDTKSGKYNITPDELMKLTAVSRENENLRVPYYMNTEDSKLLGEKKKILFRNCIQLLNSVGNFNDFCIENGTQHSPQRTVFSLSALLYFEYLHDITMRNIPLKKSDDVYFQWNNENL